MRVRSLRWRILLPPFIILLFGGLVLNRVIPNAIFKDQVELFQAQFANETEVLSRLAAAEWPSGSLNSLAREWAADTNLSLIHI